MKRDRIVYGIYMISVITQFFSLSYSGKGAYLLGIKQNMKTTELDLLFFISFSLPVMLLMITFMDQLDFYLFNYGRFQITRQVSFLRIIRSIEERIFKIATLMLLIQFIFNRTFTREAFLLFISYALICIMLINLMLVISLMMPVTLGIIILSVIHLISYYATYYHKLPALLFIGKFVHGAEYLTQVSPIYYFIIDILIPIFIISFCFITLVVVCDHKDYF